MITFDKILPKIYEIFSAQSENLKKIGELIINRDLNGRVRLVVNESVQSNPEAQNALESIVAALTEELGQHTFAKNQTVLFEENVTDIIRDAPNFPFEGFDNVTVVDRLTTATNWVEIAPIADGAPRIVFFSIKGGVGRSTALAIASWSLAQQGKRVLVLDLDLESPGLSSSLLPKDRRPTFGITDWLVEDLVDNGDSVLADMVATSTLSHDGEIYVVPAHGREPGEYIAKLGRAWMPKVAANGVHEAWFKRLNRLLNRLEDDKKPDVILIDSRAGIDEVASACVTGLGAKGVLLFAIDGEQTWSGYQILLKHWLQAGVAENIRERLQLVGAMIPELGSAEYFDRLRERAWDLFIEELYDAIPEGGLSSDYFSFDEMDIAAPHYPLAIKWHRGFAALQSLHSRLAQPDTDEITAIFGPLIEGVNAFAARDE